MPTLQAADINQLEPGLDSATTFPPANPQEPVEVRRTWRARLSCVRGYCALGVLLIVTLSGYAALFVLFDRMIASGIGG